MQFGRKKDWPHGKEIPDYKDEPWLSAVMIIIFLVAKLIVMNLPITVMLFLATMAIMILARLSSLSPPITVTLLPTHPRQYNTRDRQLVLNRLPILPLSGALYVTFNSVQIDFVYFIDAYVSHLECFHIVESTLASGKACKIAAKEGKRFYRQSCSRRKVRGGDRSSQ